jgi:hypothetical protein
MVGSDDDGGRSRRLGVEDRGWSIINQVLGGRMTERSGDAVCGLHHAQEDDERVFLGSASKSRSTVSPELASKPVAMVHGSASKLFARVSRFGHQNRLQRFDDLIHKITATVFWFVPQNPVGGGLSICASKPMCE